MMTLLSTYVSANHSVGDAALRGAIQGLFVVLLFYAAAGFIWLCRKWRQWFANNFFVRVLLPATVLGGLLGWGGIAAYLYGGGATGLAVFGILLALPFIIYLRWTAGSRFKP